MEDFYKINFAIIGQKVPETNTEEEGFLFVEGFYSVGTYLDLNIVYEGILFFVPIDPHILFCL